MQPFDILIKPVGAACNLRCRYCYYLEKQRMYPAGGGWRMSDAVLERVIRDYIRACEGQRVLFTFHGGEPTLLGVGFFEKVVALQRLHGGGRSIENAIQTNGTLLDEEWGEFLARNRFLVGISIDGPEDLHDAFRMDRGGGASFAQAMRGLEILRRFKVEFNTLSCVNSLTARHPARVYKFLHGAGSRFMQFIPVVERKADIGSGLDNAAPPDPLAAPPQDRPPEMTEWSVAPRAYGDFLCRIFDLWLAKDAGKVFVQLFDTALAHWLGIEGGLCFFRETCGCALVVEHNGDVYACDHYVYPRYLLGNVMDASLTDLAAAAAVRQLGEQKRDTLPAQCRACPYLFACNAECPSHRFCRTKDGEWGLNYLCPAYRHFFKHIAPAMETMSASFLQ